MGINYPSPLSLGGVGRCAESGHKFPRMEIPQQALMSPDRLFPKQVPPILLMGQVGKVLGWLQEFGSLSQRKATKEKKKTPEASWNRNNPRVRPRAGRKGGGMA